MKVKPKHISEHAINGIVCTSQCVWVTQERSIYFLNFVDLAIEGSIYQENERQDYIIGQLSFDPGHDIVWSAHVGGVIIAAWDAFKKCHLYDVDTGKHLKKIIPMAVDNDVIITAMTPALDTVWVGMASGHIMVFQEDELLSWFHPYEGNVSFLTLIPSAGPCEMEKAIVASGGNSFVSLVEGFEETSTEEDEISPSNSQGGTIIMWEAYEAKTLKQIKIIEEMSPAHLDNHNNVRQTIHRGEFQDGTHIMFPTLEDSVRDLTPEAEVLVQSMNPIINHELRDSLKRHNTSLWMDSLPNGDKEEMILNQTTPCDQTITSEQETFNIKLLDLDDVMIIRCPRPVSLTYLLAELKVTFVQETSQLGFIMEGKTFKIQSQEDLDAYLRMHSKPQIVVW